MKYVLSLLICIATVAVAQKTDTVSDIKDLEKMTRQLDSTTKNMEAAWEQQYKEMKERELKRTLEQNTRNMESFLQMQKEQQAKEKRAMWMRIGVGILFLGVLIFGVMRRKKKV